MTTVLFETQHLYYLPQFLPLMVEMQKRENYQLFASLTNGASSQALQRFQEEMLDRGIKVINGKSERDRLHKCQALRADVIIIGNVGQVAQIAHASALVVMVYHGIGLKESYYRDSSPRIDLFAVESQQRYEAMVERGFSRQRLVLTGFTKLDPLFHSQLELNDQHPNRADNQREGKTILYAPTFYPSSVEKTLQLFLLRPPPGNVIIKLHQFSWEMPKYRHHLDLARKVAQQERFQLISQYEFNILPYYQEASVLVSDLSSTMFEYLALDRPIVQTLYFTLRQKHRLLPSILKRRLDQERMASIDFTTPVHEPEKLIPVLKDVFTEDSLATKRQQAIKRFHYRLDGLASQRLVEAIENKLGHGSL